MHVYGSVKLILTDSGNYRKKNTGNDQLLMSAMESPDTR